jgi:hypothetical protein
MEYNKSHEDYQNTNEHECEKTQLGCSFCKDQPCKQEWCPFTEKEDKDKK